MSDDRTSLSHIAIIMDGNSRWAKERSVSRKKGHQRGAEVAKNITLACRDMGLDYLTLYAFSSENWNRSKKEVSDLMGILRYYIRYEFSKLHKENIRIVVIGDRARLDPDIQKDIESCEETTKSNTGLTVCLALSYGSREEIAHAVRHVANQVAEGIVDPSMITADDIAGYLYTASFPDPDLLIRTSGESRISNFLLWQLAYTELFFTDTLWPDFSKEELSAIMANYQMRERRFGGRID